MRIPVSVLALLFLSITFNHAKAQRYTLQSPDKKTTTTITVNDSVTYGVTYKGNVILQPSAIRLTLDRAALGTSVKLKKAGTSAVNKNIKPLYGKNAVLSEKYNQLKLDLEGNYNIIFRAYNEGVAYRFVTSLGDSVKVLNEQVNFKLEGAPAAIVPQTDNYTAWEVPYINYESTEKVASGTRAITPSLFAYNNGVKVVVAEADLFEYPGMYIKKQPYGFSGDWAAYPAETVMGSWGNFVSVVKRRERYLAKTIGSRQYPWRVVMVTDDDRTLLTNELIYKLSRPSLIKNTAWIKPGKATWEWWHDAMLPGVNIPSGMPNRNTALYNYYIDFAARHKLEYLMIDAGWSDNYDVKKILTQRVDMNAIMAHAKSKNVGVFLWCVAVPLLNDLEKNLDFIKQLGAVGIKVDFFDRDDQQAIGWMETIARAAAKRQLMVNFHGCAKPAGLQRTYPNAVNFEAVRGEECSKWDYTANPQHHLTFPFIRMLGGPLDYTPGSMRNATQATFKPIDPGLPSSLGTRCHELAMYVLFDQPFAMLSDSPAEYDKYPDIMQYLSAVPTVFDVTKVVDAKVSEYAIVAKRKGNSWFIGGMTNWTERNITLYLSFLPKGKTLKAELYTDGADANTVATSYTHKSITVTAKSRLDITMAKGGGFAMYIHP